MKKNLGLFLMVLLISACGIQPITDEESEVVDDPTTEVTEDDQVPDQEEEVVQEEQVEVSKAKMVKITGDILNVRDIPTTVDSTKLGVVREDGVYEVLSEAIDDEDRIWYEIEYKAGEKGWIASWFTEVYENPFNYDLTADQWRDYNSIVKSMNNIGKYSSPLRKDMLFRSLVYDFDSNGEIDTVYFDMELAELELGTQSIAKVTIIYEDQSAVFNYTENGEYGWGIKEFGVIDVNESDDTVEFYVKQGDLADRVIYGIYQIKDGKLIQVSTMSGEILGVSGDGKIYYWGGNLMEPGPNDRFSPDLVTSYFDLELKEYVPTDQIVGKEIPVSWKVILYTLKEDVIDGAPREWDALVAESESTRVAILEEGVVMTVLEHDHMTSRTKVSTDNGYEGWIGGFHMVWD